MKVYTFDAAPNARRLALFMQYKGIEIETEQIDMAGGEQLGEAYRRINPAATVPALVTDEGPVLSQVIGQCTYLEERFPDKPLLGTTPLEKAQVISWCHQLFNGLTSAIALVFRNRAKGFVDRALPGPLNLPQIPALIERGETMIAYLLPELDAHLAESTWVAGDNFSMADIDLYTSIGFLGWIKQSIPQECTHLQAWYERAEAELA